MAQLTAHVPEPDLKPGEALPVSAAFGDVYFSREGGVAETEHVFLRGNGLPERWQGKERFTIGELGFGTGLNFLVTLRHFRATADVGAMLHYVAVEKYLFARESLRVLLAMRPELAEEAEELLAAYPLRLPGAHRIHLPRATLTLYVGDVTEMLNYPASGSNHSGIEAWFLDGFSPAKNPDMWSDAVMAQLGRLSASGATCATFSSAGAVRRGLVEAGFVVEKRPGFGHKRDMCVGVRSFAAPATNAAPAGCKRGIVIGAGIAGAPLARALAERGHQVTVIERDRVASGASGNRAGVLFPQITKQWSITSAFYFTAYGFMLRQIERWRTSGLVFAHASPGMIRLPRDAEEATHLRAIRETLGIDPAIARWVEREEAGVIAGAALETGGVYFPQGTWISPEELCHALLQHKHIMLHKNNAAISIRRDGETWYVTLADANVMQADYVCVACAYGALEMLADHGLSLHEVGGQVSEIAAANVAYTLRSILCKKGYVIPLGERYLVGATYHRDAMLEVTDDRHAQNTAELEHIVPGWLRGSPAGGRSSIRTTTPDRLPYIGALEDGLYVSIGHGSRGLLSAPIAAEMIASHIAQELSPVDRDLADAVRPGRFREK